MQPLPQKGFYVHFKSDTSKHPHDHMYEVLGIAKNTEDMELMVMYRPLYPNDFLAPAECMVRPAKMFMETVEKDGKSFPRFSRITDESLVLELKKAITEISSPAIL